MQDSYIAEDIDIAGHDESPDVVDQLEQMYGDDLDLLAGTHHARYLPADVPFHVISRVFQGRHLLRPCKALNSIIGGVLGRAQAVYPSVMLFATVFLSNHLHMMLQGPTRDVVCFIGFVKREISRRWGSYPGIHWPGTMWHSYVATALPTPESQVTCLKYILSQGVKEGLVAKPQLWPGVHSAKQLLAGVPLNGEWFDGTAYAIARDREARSAHPRPIPKTAFYQRYEAKLTPIEPWSHLSEQEYRARIKTLCDEIADEGGAARAGRPALGAKAILEVPRERRTELPTQPWLADRRKMICWADRRAPETRAFIDRHWTFQRSFRAAARALLAGDRAAVFPSPAFIPSIGPPRSRLPAARPD